LKYTCQGFQEGILGKKKPILFGPQIKTANSGQNPSRGKIICFHTRYLNGNILSFWYQNQAIQEPKFMYTHMTTTFIKDSKSNKIVLKDKIRTQSDWSKWVFWSDSETDNVILIQLRVWHKNSGPYNPIKVQINPLACHEWKNIAGMVGYCKKPS
jgi:hypothetical protein